MYTATITKSGQVTLPKELRDFLGVKLGGKITFDKVKDGLAIRRKLTKDEFFREMDKNLSPETKKIIKGSVKKSVNEMIDEYLRSPKGQEEMRRKYAI